MQNSTTVSASAARISDILEQIKSLNEMIALHKQNKRSSLMLHQYSEMKDDFMSELKGLMKEYQLEVAAA
ncbi:MAG: hypothetical protein ACI85O_001868 [Saprospiraceae bacterium]|jgi:hypothetical protein